MPKVEAQDNVDIDDEERTEDDLKILNEMDIDKDFNIWSDFRNSFSVAKKDSISQLNIACSGKLESSFSQSLGSISEHDQAKLHHDETDVSPACSRASQHVRFSPLSLAERRNIRASVVRLERKQVFSRYYFPETWELREKEAIQRELLLKEPLVCSEIKANQPNEVTHATLNSIFFPGDNDPQSVLLKRGPTLIDGTEERELLLFTYGFVLSRIEFDNMINLLFDMNSVKCASKKDSDETMQKRFNTIDSDSTGELDRCELREVFQSMGVPISEQMLSEVMDRFDMDNSGTIDFQEFKQVFNELTPKDEPQSYSLFGNLRKTLMGGLSKSDIKRKLDMAFPLSDVERVESLHICHSAKTEMFANSSWAQISFAIFIRSRNHPLILVCSKPEHREAWISAFKVCLINSRMLGGSTSQTMNGAKPGWQHELVRESLFSLVICDDHDRLTELLEGPPIDMNVNDCDDYYGYTALHYAVIWDRFDCATQLLANGAKVNSMDNDKKTPMDYATEKSMVNLLKKYGGQCNPNLKGILYDQQYEEQKLKKSNIPQRTKNVTAQQANTATGALNEAMSAMKERGERLEKLDNAAASLGNEAANYAVMTKQLKEKTKKKSLFGLKY